MRSSSIRSSEASTSASGWLGNVGTAAAITLLGGNLPTAFGQESGGTLEEVIVTAQRREILQQIRNCGRRRDIERGDLIVSALQLFGAEIESKPQREDDARGRCSI